MRSTHRTFNKFRVSESLVLLNVQKQVFDPTLAKAKHLTFTKGAVRENQDTISRPGSRRGSSQDLAREAVEAVGRGSPWPVASRDRWLGLPGQRVLACMDAHALCDADAPWCATETQNLGRKGLKPRPQQAALEPNLHQNWCPWSGEARCLTHFDPAFGPNLIHLSLAPRTGAPGH